MWANIYILYYIYIFSVQCHMKDHFHDLKCFICYPSPGEAANSHLLMVWFRGHRWHHHANLRHNWSHTGKHGQVTNFKYNTPPLTVFKGEIYLNEVDVRTVISPIHMYSEKLQYCTEFILLKVDVGFGSISHPFVRSYLILLWLFHKFRTGIFIYPFIYLADAWLPPRGTTPSWDWPHQKSHPGKVFNWRGCLLCSTTKGQPHTPPPCPRETG